LLLEVVTLGVFCALDTTLRFFCREFMLVPLCFPISLWGIGLRRRLIFPRWQTSTAKNVFDPGQYPLVWNRLMSRDGASTE
jgi:hypothetical protein